MAFIKYIKIENSYNTLNCITAKVTWWAWDLFEKYYSDNKAITYSCLIATHLLQYSLFI